MKLYKWDNIFCDYGCGYGLALAESVQEARELIVKLDAAPGQEEAAVALFHQFEHDPAGFSASNYVSDLWQHLWSDEPAEFSISEPIAFECMGSA